MDPAVLDWAGLGTRGRSVRGGGFRRRADCGGRDREEELCSRARRGRGLPEGATLEPGLWDPRSSASLTGGEQKQRQGFPQTLLLCRSQWLNHKRPQRTPQNTHTMFWQLLCNNDILTLLNFVLVAVVL